MFPLSVVKDLDPFEDIRLSLIACLVIPEQGYAEAQLLLGAFYQDGKGVQQSQQEAVKWYRKSAENGNAIAQWSIGARYQSGIGVPQSNKEAARWFRKSAEQGNSMAQLHLGGMHQLGNGVPQSNKEAARWWRKSAEQGNSMAQGSLGSIYAQRQNYVTSLMWFSLSASQGNGNAARACNLLSKKMTPEQITEAQRLVREWQASHL